MPELEQVMSNLFSIFAKKEKIIFLTQNVASNGFQKNAVYSCQQRRRVQYTLGTLVCPEQQQQQSPSGVRHPSELFSFLLVNEKVE